MNAQDNAGARPCVSLPEGRAATSALDEWREQIRQDVLRRRKLDAMGHGATDAPIQTFAGDETELACEIDARLDEYLNILEQLQEARDAELLVIEDDIQDDEYYSDHSAPGECLDELGLSDSDIPY